VTVDDRRRNARNAIELNVEYKRINTFFSDYTRNISKGGTFIRTTRPLKLGTQFVFALRIPNLEEPLRLRGLVKWVVSAEEATAEQPVGMGIEFQYASDEERRATEEVVEGLMSRELGETLSSRLLKKRLS
jgi:type IV pilus assembly protein PilZ